MTDTDTSAEARFLIIKRGYYYRPDSCGYTAIKSEAGRYTLEDTAVRFPNESDSGLSFIHEDEADDYSPACDAMTKVQHQNKALSAERDALRAEVATMREALVEVHDDCVERAKMSRDGRTVPIGVSSWMAICNALFPDDAALKTPTSNTNNTEEE